MAAPDWDAKYGASEGSLYGEAPNDYLRMVLARPGVAPRRALMLADGEGRNGRYLAGLGLAVVAVDGSRVGTEKARRLDVAAGVRVERIHADLADWVPAGETDLAGLFYLHCEPEVRDRAILRAVASLAPGGWFVAEVFAKAQAARPGMGPDRPDNLYAAEALAALLPPDMVLVEALEGLVRLDEGTGHHGLGAVVRVLARRAG